MSYETYEELKKKKNQRQNFSFIFERIQVSSGASGEVKYTEEVSVPVGGSGKRHPLLLQWYRAHSRCPPQSWCAPAACPAANRPAPVPGSCTGLPLCPFPLYLHCLEQHRLRHLFALPSPFLSHMQSHPMCSSLGERWSPCPPPRPHTTTALRTNTACLPSNQGTT